MFSSNLLTTIVIQAVDVTANAIADLGIFAGYQRAWTSRIEEHLQLLGSAVATPEACSLRP